MKNFKKLIAMGAALAMAMIMSVSAFAAGETANDPITGAYADGAVVVSAIKAALPTMTEGAQYTVVVVPVGEEISDSNIHYINQAAGNDAVWAESTTWGTPEDLEDLDADTYVVRIGDEAGNVEEIYFRVGEEQSSDPELEGTVYIVGDLNGDDSISPADLAILCDYILNKIDMFTKSSDSSVLPKLVGDTNGDESVTPADLGVVLDKILNKIESFDEPTYTLPANTSAESTY